MSAVADIVSNTTRRSLHLCPKIWLLYHPPGANPDTPCRAVNTAVAGRSFAPVPVLGNHSRFLGAASLEGIPQQMLANGFTPLGVGQVSWLLPSVWLEASISISTTYSDLFSIHPKVSRNVTAPVKFLCQMPCSPVQGVGNETTPSCAISKIRGVRGPLSIPGGQVRV